MAYLIKPFGSESLEGASARLVIAHDFLVAAMQNFALQKQPWGMWGIGTKRQGVPLSGVDRPRDIGKHHEAVSELVNMLATMERMLGAWAWFRAAPEFTLARVAECHPTTSDVADSNDLVLADQAGLRVALVEVCDVVSARGDGNQKELSSLRKLGCSSSVPGGAPSRFIATSPEFARRLLRRRRVEAHYRYEHFEVGDDAGTVMLRLMTNA